MAKERDRMRAENRYMRRVICRLRRMIQNLLRCNSELGMLWNDETRKNLQLKKEKEDLEARIIGLRFVCFYSNAEQYGLGEEGLELLKNERMKKAAKEIADELIRMKMITVQRTESRELDGYKLSYGIEFLTPKEEE